MSRYFTRPKATKPRSFDIDEDYPLIPELRVNDHKAVDTGLVALTGEPIMRAPNPIGFGRDGEW